MQLDDRRLLTFARGAAGRVEHQRAAAHRERGDPRTIGSQTAWSGVVDLDARVIRILAAASASDADIWANAH